MGRRDRRSGACAPTRWGGMRLMYTMPLRSYFSFSFCSFFLDSEGSARAPASRRARPPPACGQCQACGILAPCQQHTPPPRTRQPAGPCRPRTHPCPRLAPGRAGRRFPEPLLPLLPAPRPLARRPARRAGQWRCRRRLPLLAGPAVSPSAHASRALRPERLLDPPCSAAKGASTNATMCGGARLAAATRALHTPLPVACHPATPSPGRGATPRTPPGLHSAKAGSTGPVQQRQRRRTAARAAAATPCWSAQTRPAPRSART